MWQLYVKYALPILVLSIVGISIFRALKQHKREVDPKKKTKIRKICAITITVTFLLSAVVTMILLK